jgi:hypothetical protein
MQKLRKLTIVLAAMLLSGCEGPHVWNYTALVPADSDLIGTYKATRQHGQLDVIADFSRNDLIQIVLKADHTAEISNFPEFDQLADSVLCRISGPGTWRLDRGPGPEIRFHVKSLPKPDVPPSINDHHCTPDVELSLLGHMAPYRFYWAFGDPDDDRGLEFERVKP